MERNGEKEREKVWRGRRDYRRQEREKTQFEGVVLRSNLAIGQSKMKTCWTRFYARSTAWKDSELLPNRTLISQMASKPWCTRWRRNAKVFATAFGGKWGRPCRNWSVYIGNKFSKLSKERNYGETMSDPLDTTTTRFFENLPPFNEVQTSPQPYSPDMYSARVRPSNESAKQPGYALLECNQNSHVRISNLAASTNRTVEPTTRGIFIPSVDWQKPNRRIKILRT